MSDFRFEFFCVQKIMFEEIMNQSKAFTFWNVKKTSDSAENGFD